MTSKPIYSSLSAKRFLLVILVGASSLCYGQVTDNFSDGDFTLSPTWTGDGADFIINATPEQRLQLNAAGAGDSYLSTNFVSTSLDSVEWSFYIRQSFAPSGSNYGRVYLASDQVDVTGPVNGYYLQFGEAGALDQVELFRQTGVASASVLRGTTLIASPSFEISVKVKRDALGNWELFIDPLAGTNYVSEATGTEASHTTSSNFGMYCLYTASNTTKFYFDNIYMGPWIFDTSPPTITSLNVISSTAVDVKYSERVDQVTAETVTNYSANNGLGNPLSATRDGADLSLVHLVYATPFASGVTNTLTINNVEDVANNPIMAGSTDVFTYFLVVPATWGDVIITEIMADPTPQVALPNSDFIELHNRSSNFFDLVGWEFSDGGTPAVLGNHVLAPGGYVIVCPTASVIDFSGFGDVLGVASFPGLNIAGDNLTVRDSSGTLVDGVNYLLSWYKDGSKDDGGYTLELINPDAPCSGSDNWAASTSTWGGTPGQQNSIFSNALDITNPAVSGLNVLQINQLEVVFSESMDSSSLATASYAINNGIAVTSITLIQPDYLSVEINLANNLDSSAVYELTITGATDCSGNTLPAIKVPFAIGIIATRNDLLITEIYADPNPDISPDLPEAEFIEIFNTTSDVISLKGYTIADASTTSTIASGYILPNEYLTICSASFRPLFEVFGRVASVSSLPSLNNAGDELKLRDNNGNLINYVQYSDEWYQDDVKDGGGWTLELVNPNNTCPGGNNWKASNNPIGGTPGAQNSVYDLTPDTDSPSLLTAYVWSNTSIELRFDEAMDTVTALTASYVLSNGIGIGSITSVAPSYLNIMLTLSSALDTNEIVRITVRNIQDCPGNTISATNSVQLGLPARATVGDLIINEVLFDARTGGSDFVEIYNNSGNIISLANWELANFDKDTISNNSKITELPELLFPGEYYALTEDPVNILEEYPLSVVSRLFKVVDVPTYNNDEGSVYLITPQNEISDLLEFTDGMQFALLNNPDGVSLERTDFNRPSSEVTNWHSAAESVGFATPGYKNSQYYAAESEDDLVTIDPQIFSPDNDGYQDQVNISYRLDGPSYVGNITIFDAKGRLIRYLMRSELLAPEGTISWDGITEEREKARTGIFIVYFEAFDLNGKVVKQKKTCVLASRL